MGELGSIGKAETRNMLPHRSVGAQFSQLKLQLLNFGLQQYAVADTASGMIL